MGGPTVQRVCRFCGEMFTVWARQARRRNRAQFCGRSCQGKDAYRRIWAGRDRTGENNPHWKGGISRDHYHYKRLFVMRHPEKAAAHKAVRIAVQSGLLVRPCQCAQCMEKCKPAGHHEDYARPLEVRWLCRKCHRIADEERQRRESLRRAS